MAGATWVLVVVGLRATVALPEACPDVTPAELEEAAAATIGWFEANAHANGHWTYEYRADEDTITDGYSIVRHAGVLLSLYQAADAGVAGALAVADAGLAFALRHAVEEPGWTAFGQPGAEVPTGASALLVAALVERREATGEGRYDELLAAHGRFLAGQVEPDGAVLAAWDPASGAPVADRYSVFFTGEAFWALARLHTAFPGDGWDRPARLVGRYLATQRDQAEGRFPPVHDHWAAYGLDEVGRRWPAPRGRAAGTADAGPEGGRAVAALGGALVGYAHRLAGLLGTAARFQAKTGLPALAELVDGPARAAALGTTGEGLGALWRLAGADPDLRHLRSDLAQRVTCAAGILAEQQVSAAAAGDLPRPDLVQGAWLTRGATRMDDQQHALSALLAAEAVLADG